MTDEPDEPETEQKPANLAASYLQLGDTSSVLAQRAAIGDISKLVKMPDLSGFLGTPPALRLIDTSWINNLVPRVPLPSFDGLVASQAVQSVPLALSAAVRSWSLPPVNTSFAAVGALADIGKMITAWRNPLEGFKWVDFTPVLPPNLRDIDVDLERVSELVYEGVTLYGVPGSLLARRLLAAPDKASRRAILGRELVRVARDCDEALDICVAPSTRESVSFARRAIAAIRDGHVEAGQALASNALDSLLRTWFSRHDYVLYTSHKKTTSDDVDDWDVRTHMALGPIWAAHEEFRPGGTALIPATYARHATTHAVSGRQYNRRNAAQALLLLTSLIVYVNEEVAYPQPAAS